MSYIRHRDRMVQESVFEDLRDTLIACRWMAGTTKKKLAPVGGPVHPAYIEDAGETVENPARVQITTTESQVMKIVGKREGGAVAQVVLVDFFPETELDSKNLVGEQETSRTELNTLAMDDGQPGQTSTVELGSSLVEQPYRYNLAFWASSDAVAKAVLNDLRDRYQGRLTNDEYIPLYDYNTDPDAVAGLLEVDSFSYQRNLDQAGPSDLHLWFAELVVIDVVDGNEA